MKDKTKFGGVFTLEHIRDGEMIHKQAIHNIVVDEGLKYLLNTALHATTAVTTWYVSIFDNIYTPVAADTGATIAGAGKCGAFTSYDESTRVEYEEATASNSPVTTTNSANKATFTINATETIQGAFLISTSTKDGTGDAASTLIAAAAFTSPRSVVDDDVLLVTYEFVASDA